MLRCILFTAGLMITVLGLGLGVTIVMLPVGAVMALLGGGVLLGRAVKGLPLPLDT